MSVEWLPGRRGRIAAPRTGQPQLPSLGAFLVKRRFDSMIAGKATRQRLDIQDTESASVYTSSSFLLEK